MKPPLEKEELIITVEDVEIYTDYKLSFDVIPLRPEYNRIYYRMKKWNLYQVGNLKIHMTNRTKEKINLIAEDYICKNTNNEIDNLMKNKLLKISVLGCNKKDIRDLFILIIGCTPNVFNTRVLEMVYACVTDVLLLTNKIYYEIDEKFYSIKKYNIKTYFDYKKHYIKY